MANLRFQEISWDEKRLMYVAFAMDGKIVRWYPKWREVAELISSAWATEYGLNNDKLTSYLTFEMLTILCRDLLNRREGTAKDFYDLIKSFNKLTGEISDKLIEKIPNKG